MDEKELGFEDKVLSAIETLTNEIETLKQQNAQLESVLYDGIIGGANQLAADEEYNNALSDFRCKYVEKLGPYEAIVKSIDNSDVFEKAFNEYNEGDYTISPDEYVDALVDKLHSTVDLIKQTDLPEEVKEEVVEAIEEEIPTDEKEPEVEVTVEKEEKPKSEEDEIAEFEEELRKERDRE